jgi:hypothetical protein
MLPKFLLAPFLFVACIAQETCPELPNTGVEIGQPVPIKPENIPRGCSNFEILVGSTYLISSHNNLRANNRCSSRNE